jgi:ferritin
MKIAELLNHLLSDLANEYSHWHFYMAASTSIKGLHRHEIGEFFLEQASGEMKHIEEFRRLIQGIITRRGLEMEIPTLVADFEEGLSCPKLLLAAALEMEEKVVENYVNRTSHAAELKENGGEDAIDGKYVEIFLEDQILDSRSDADNIREMLESGLDG